MCQGNRQARFGKRPTEKDPHHGHLAGGPLHSGSGSEKPTDGNAGRALRADFHHNFLHLPLGVEDALAEARGLRTSFTLAHQYLDQLPPEMNAAIGANARNKIYFALSPADARACARHLAPHLDEGDLTRLGAHEAALRPIAAGRALPACTLDALPPPPARSGRAEALRRAARRRTGLDRATRRTLRVNRLTRPHIPGLRRSQQPPRRVGLPLNTTERPAGPSLEPSVDPSLGHEQPGERSTLRDAFTQPSTEEERP